METLRAIIRGDLSPAGNRISLVREPQAFGYGIEGYSAIWVDSGTSALALALIDVKRKAPHVAIPKVIIPGYCCPDLVAAATYAGVKPVVVDICLDDASYDLDALQAAVADENVVAIVAVNFLGIKERLADIKTLVQNSAIKIIEDNAQWFPASKAQHQFLGDYLLFSFGRGKPLSLLGGGVLFSKESLVVADEVVEEKSGSAVKILKTHLYNILLEPHFYCYLNRAPFLHLGETHYHQHENITSIGTLQRDIFATNRQTFEQRESQREKDYDDFFKPLDLQGLASIQGARRMRLLRYPLLCKSMAQRDNFLELLQVQGLGVSPLYQRAIVEIPHIAELVEVHGDLKNSRQFARCLLTLPTHEHVTSQHFSRMQEIFSHPKSL